MALPSSLAILWISEYVEPKLSAVPRLAKLVDVLSTGDIGSLPLGGEERCGLSVGLRAAGTYIGHFGGRSWRVWAARWCGICVGDTFVGVAVPEFVGE